MITHRSNPDLPPDMKTYVEIGYLPMIEGIAKKMSAPLWWTVADDSGSLRRQSGTICFVHTGKRVIGVGAGHVHQMYLEQREAHPDIACQIGSASFDPEERLIDFSTDPDIATYDLSEVYITAAGGHLHSAPVWPPVVLPRDAYLVGGWPWDMSRESDVYAEGPYAGQERVTHSFLNFLTPLAAHSERNLSFQIPTETSVPWGEVSLDASKQLGGMSGGPIYRIQEDGLTRVTLVGCTYEWNRALGIVYAHPLSLVAPGGGILR